MKVYTPDKRWPKVVLATIVVVALGLAGWYGWQWYEQKQARETTRQSQREQETEQPELSLEERFVERYYEVDFPRAERIETPPEITGTETVDSHVQRLAEERGYRLQFTPTKPLKRLNGEKLQPRAIRAWKKLKKAAREDGIYMGLVSGHRSVQKQRIIFDSQLRQQAQEAQGGPYTAQQITSGEADQAIDQVLQEYSLPGYSKHHSGYALDIKDTASNTSFDEFGKTEAFQWLSANDYEKARQFGFLPSYPEGADNLGPEAELWEYVWVGADNTEFPTAEPSTPDEAE